MEDLATFATGLAAHPSGYWVAKVQHEVSYPQGGNDACLSIEDGSFWFQHRNAIITDVVRLFPPEGPIFDIGGGNGYVARGLEKAGFPAVLVEPGAAGASNAVKRGLKHVVCSTMETAGFRPNTLPAIGLFDVLEHIDDDLAFLASLQSLMKADGRIYVTVPAFQTLWSADDAYAGHYRRYSTKSLSRCLERAGFGVEYVTYFFWLLMLPVLVCRTVPSLIGLRRTTSVGNMRREHSTGSGVVSLLVSHALGVERKRIQQKKVMPFGGSCLAVARNRNLAG
ncbi:MAG: class I SAM-dependent methyltransferase [Chloroflexi bacterium]|nr:class I SAM-dependent methyltransferase [Chloroflexota bacterium]